MPGQQEERTNLTYTRKKTTVRKKSVRNIIFDSAEVNLTVCERKALIILRM